MLNRCKELLKKFMFDFPPVVIKFYKEKPEGIPRSEKRLPLCKFVKEAQFAESKFYIDINNDACFGKLSLGMVKKPNTGVAGIAGIIGFGYDIYGSPMACQNLYNQLPALEHGTANYVVFSRIDNCDFEPDLVFVFCDVKQAEIIMRASCYLTGDLWESKSAPVVNCAWMYAYPVISGKVNYIISEMSHDIKVRKSYPGSLVMIAIPHQKFEDVLCALESMPWVTLPFREDQKSKDKMKRQRILFETIGKLFGNKFSP